MKPYIPILGALLVGVVLGHFTPSFSTTIADEKDVREQSHEFKYINPLLECGDENFAKLSNDRQSELESKFEAYITTQKTKGAITEASVYFRELNGGNGLGVNSGAIFTPGSLLKVPLVMSVYQRAEKDPGLMSRIIEFGGGSVPAEEYFKAATITLGTKYSVEDLVRAAIVNSDNNAAELLSMLINKDELDASYSHLGIKIPTDGMDYSMAVRTYASFFRILYNATFIDHEASEHLLGLLTQTTFTKGLVAGVPPGTVVAHKFGERAIEDESGVQLHDCGIIYHPKQPYLLCVMMRGKDFDILAKDISEISKIAYDYAE